MQITTQSAPRSRQITTPTPHHSIFTGQVLFLTPNQQCQSSDNTNRVSTAPQTTITTITVTQSKQTYFLMRVVKKALLPPFTTWYSAALTTTERQPTKHSLKPHHSVSHYTVFTVYSRLYNRLYDHSWLYNRLGELC